MTGDENSSAKSCASGMRAADPEREYIEAILPLKLQLAADYAARAGVASDLRVLWRTLRLLLQR